MNTLLSFGIPTYNRAAILDEALDYYYNTLHLESFYLFISDNCSTDQTYDIVQKYKGKYDNIIYFKQTQNIGADQNFLFLQDNCPTKYYMLLGDGVRMRPEAMKQIIREIGTLQYDLVAFDYKGRSTNPTQIYTNSNQLLVDIGWYITQVSSYVISRDIIESTKELRFIYDGCEFNYYQRIFYYAAQHKFKYLWLNIDAMSFTSLEKKNSWNERFPRVWLREYVSAILSLPSSYLMSSKVACLKEASKYYFFTTTSIIKYIEHGIITSSFIISNKHAISFILKHSWRFYYILSLMPKFVLALITRLIHFYQKVCY